MAWNRQLVYHADMGVTRVKATLFNLAVPSRRLEIELMVDSGAVYTWPVGDAGFAIGSRQGASVVVFGQDDSPTLLGVATLEELGLGLDPVRRALIPVPLPLFRVRPGGLTLSSA